MLTETFYLGGWMIIIIVIIAILAVLCGTIIICIGDTDKKKPAKQLIDHELIDHIQTQIEFEENQIFINP